MSKTRIGVILALLAALATALVVAGCGDDDDDAGGLTKEEGTLLVGSDIPYPPFEQGKAPDYDGFDIDLVNEVVKKLDLDVTYEDTSFDTIFRDLAQGKFDMVASATSITPERESGKCGASCVDFSNPYYNSAQGVVVEEGSDIKSVDDLSGATVGVQQGTTGQAFVEDETDAGDVRPFPEGPDSVNAVQTGQVDAAVVDLPVAQDAVEKQSGIEVATSIPTDEQYGLAFPEDSDELREKVNDALQELKDDGTYTEIYNEWFDEDPPEEVLDATNEPK